MAWWSSIALSIFPLRAVTEAEAALCGPGRVWKLFVISLTRFAAAERSPMSRHTTSLASNVMSSPSLERPKACGGASRETASRFE